MRTSSKFGFVLNNCPPQPNNPRPEKMATGLSTIGPVAPVRIVRRADYQDAYAEGKGVTEWAPDSPAAQEVRQLLQWINEQTKGQSLEQAPSLAIGF
jgi:chromosome partitioning protein